MVGVRRADALRSGAGAGDPLPVADRRPRRVCGGNRYRLAKSGILIKTQDVLENLYRVTHVFFDKTGTLTVKQPQVTRVEMLPGAGTHLNETTY